MIVNVLIVQENNRIERVDLIEGMVVSGQQSTEIHETDVSAAQALLEYVDEGAFAPQRAIDEAREILATE